MAQHDHTPKPVHVVRLGTAVVALQWYLQGHEDAVSWTPDVRKAIPFLSADVAKRYAARRLGGAWHVAEIDRGAFGRTVIEAPDEIDSLPERDAGVEAEVSRPAADAILITRAQGDAVAAHRRAIRLRATSPWAA